MIFNLNMFRSVILVFLLLTSTCGLTVKKNPDTNATEMQKFNFSATSLSLDITDELLSTQWNMYKESFDKEYEDSEEKIRKDVFLENYKRIKEHNRMYKLGGVSYKLGINQFTDQSNIEVAATMNGFKGAFRNKLLKANFYRPKGIQLPTSVDWRSIDSPPTVKNQGSCGSCWAFTVTGALEFHWQIHKNEKVYLSEQHLLDCTEGNYGCKGGYISKAFDFVIKNKGVSTADKYPYYGQQGICRTTGFNITAAIKGYLDITKDEKILMEVLMTMGPVAAAMDASRPKLLGYQNGIYMDPMCSNSLVNHGVLVVGYGTSEEGIDYWIVRNSWGPRWGENGYVKIGRKNNLCGILNMVTVPIVEN